MNAQNKPLVIDGRVVRCFLFARKSPLGGHPVFWQVEGFDVDHALSRLCEQENWIARSEWELVEELDPEHDVGALGRKLPMLPHGAIIPTFRSILRH